ncbi:hypothetical protein [Novosphingobium sp.]|uniref:hypothetical protein n=1 Tax=Novosphingobium sp. TaxID=1874826 RepID=UPI002734F3DD|nr:hypothetical protein [Novosphingobium sp.]MDP3906315.1 hypothetical protein [Novosphingobium sp.]
MPARFALALILLPLLAACGGGGGGTAAGKVQSASKKPALTKPALAIPRPPMRTGPLTARIQSAPGLEGVIGASPADLIRQFGTARLDVWEGDARKLQFASDACVLDVYLYPAAPGREPQATYVDARRAGDGQEVDRAACIVALRKR